MKRGPKPYAMETAMRHLKRLAEQYPAGIPVVLVEDVSKTLNISMKTMHRAKKALGLKSYKRSFFWLWR